MIPGLCVKQSNQSLSNKSLPYTKHSGFVNDILSDNIIGEFYGRILKYNGGGRKNKKKTRKIKKKMIKKKTKKDLSSFF